ncbi:hypothetical protein HY772_01820 [Candidatus Woesearchaeota archaeon]|nr:hypothetical protein [Candidatus Woesearchaeota archaeon]
MAQTTDQTSEFHLSDDDLRRIMDKVEEAKARRANLSTVLDNAAISREIDELYSSLGEDIAPEIRDEAVSTYFDELYAFDAPKRGLSYAAAKAYVNRAKAKAPLIATVVVAALAVGVVKAGTAISRASHEHDAEVAATEARSQRADLKHRIDALDWSQVKKDLPAVDSSDLERIVVKGNESVAGSAGFFDKYCPHTACSEGITGDNFAVVSRELASVKQTLDAVAVDVMKGEAIVKLQTDLNDTKRMLDSVFDQVIKSDMPDVFVGLARSAYDSGIGAVGHRDADAAKVRIDQLTVARDDGYAFVELRPQPLRLYDSIVEVAKEDHPKTEAKSLLDEALRYVKSVEVVQLKVAVGKLKGIEAALTQEYTIIITGGKWRYPNNNRGIKNYYLTVQAKAPGGAVIPQSITSEEDGKTETVSTWGERVPEEVYNRVGRDKQDDNIIQDNLFGKKERGYMSPKIEARFKPVGGKITRW